MQGVVLDPAPNPKHTVTGLQQAKRYNTALCRTMGYKCLTVQLLSKPWTIPQQKADKIQKTCEKRIALQSEYTMEVTPVARTSSTSNKVEFSLSMVANDTHETGVGPLSKGFSNHGNKTEENPSRRGKVCEVLVPPTIHSRGVFLVTGFKKNWLDNNRTEQGTRNSSRLVPYL